MFAMPQSAPYGKQSAFGKLFTTALLLNHHEFPEINSGMLWSNTLVYISSSEKDIVERHAILSGGPVSPQHSFG